jgi:hypothetical protein
MNALWLAIVPESDTTRILVKDGARRTVLKAHLSHPPRHPRAIPSLLEAIALWAGQPVRAVLAADEPSTSFGSTNWLDDLELSRRTPLYDISIVPRTPPGARRKDEIPGVGDFADLEELLIEEVAQ